MSDTIYSPLFAPPLAELTVPSGGINAPKDFIVRTMAPPPALDAFTEARTMASPSPLPTGPLFRTYTPPADVSFDPLTAGITGTIPSFYTYGPATPVAPPPAEGGLDSFQPSDGGAGGSQGVGGLGDGGVNMGGQMAGGIDLGPNPGNLGNLGNIGNLGLGNFSLSDAARGFALGNFVAGPVGGLIAGAIGGFYGGSSTDKGIGDPGPDAGPVSSPDKSEPGTGGDKGDPGPGPGAPGEASTSGGDMGGGPSGDSGDGYKEGGLVAFPDGEELPPEYSDYETSRDYFRELNRADAQRNLQGLPEISAFTGFDRNRGVNLMPYGARVRAEMPGMSEGDMLDLSAGYQGATASGRGFRQSRNLLREAGAGYTLPDGGRLSLDYFDRMDGGDMSSGPSENLNQDVRVPSDAEMRGRPVPSRGVRLGYRREFAAGGLVPLAGGGKIAIGPGGGLDDLIPTSINGRQAAALSDGEFVIPADVVSMLGDGSSNAGSRRLYDLMRQIRDAKTGTTRQAGPLPVGEILKRSLGQ